MLVPALTLVAFLTFSMIILGNTIEECYEIIATINDHLGGYCSLECLNSYNSYYKMSEGEPEIFYISPFGLQETFDNEWSDCLSSEKDKNIKLNNVYIRNQYHYPPLLAIASFKLTQTQKLLCSDVPSYPAIQVCCVYEDRKRQNPDHTFQQPAVKFPKVFLDSALK